MNNFKSCVKVSLDVGNLKDFEADSLVFYLGELGFDIFERDGDTLCAYISVTAYDGESLRKIAGDVPYSVEEIEDRDWNSEWERNYFKPIVIDDLCVVRSTFHENPPTARYDIVIDPKMSFGTGHHQTTRCMMRYILEDELVGRSVLDMGCGTGVLAILALMKGASSAAGIDVDEHCIRNAAENAALNKVELELSLGGAEAIAGRRFDRIFANINRNVLLADMDKYAAALNPGGILYISGFYVGDREMLVKAAEKAGLSPESAKEEGLWSAIELRG